MAVLVLLLGVLMTVVGLIGLVEPATVLGWIDSMFQKPSGLYVAALIRFVAGVILVLAAPSTRFPEVIWIIGLIAIVAALSLPLIGFRRVRSLLDWWTKTSAAVIAVSFLLLIVFGGFLIYAAS